MTDSYSNWQFYLKRITSEVWSMMLLVMAGLVLITLLGYYPTDPGWSTSGLTHQAPKHVFGSTGAYVADALLSLLGFAAYWLPIGMVHIAWQIVRSPSGLEGELVLWRLAGLAASTLVLSCILALHLDHPINSIAQTGGGLIGQVIGIALLHLFLPHHVLWIYLLLFFFSATVLFNLQWLNISYALGKLLANRAFQTLNPDASEDEVIRFQEPSSSQAEHRLSAAQRSPSTLMENPDPMPISEPKSASISAPFSWQRFNEESEQRSEPREEASNAIPEETVGFFAPKAFSVPLSDMPTLLSEISHGDYFPPAPETLITPPKPASHNTPTHEPQQIVEPITPAEVSVVESSLASEAPTVTTTPIATQPITTSTTNPTPPSLTSTNEPVAQSALPEPVAPLMADSPEETISVTVAPMSSNPTEPESIEPLEPIIEIPAHTSVRIKIKPMSRPIQRPFVTETPMVFQPIAVAPESSPETVKTNTHVKPTTQSALVEPTVVSPITPTAPVMPAPIAAPVITPTSTPQSALVEPTVVTPVTATPVTPAPVAPVIHTIPTPPTTPQSALVEPTVVSPITPTAPVTPAPIAAPVITPTPQSALVEPVMEEMSAILESVSVDNLADPAFWEELEHALEPEESSPLEQSALLEEEIIPPVVSAISVTTVASVSEPTATPVMAEVVVAEPVTPVVPAPVISATEEPTPIKEAIPLTIPAPTPKIPPISPQSALQTKSIAPNPYPDEYLLPSMHLFKLDTSLSAGYSDEELDEMANLLEHALRSYRIQASVANIEQGPVVTSFEIDPAAGTKGSQISNLDRDLARSLSVPSLRVVEVLPGKPYIGLEIPNRHRSMVHFRTILESPAYQAQTSPLTMVLGCNISGEPVVTNLGAMPHLLVAGTTGSGKSVGINVMLASMLCKAKPDELKLILIDPKMLEMSMYEGIPHLITPVVTDMNDAENALKWAVAEMERRYQLMSGLKVRKIDEFNQIIKDAQARGEVVYDPNWDSSQFVGIAQQPPILKPLPYLVIVIDELADMMMVVGKKVEDLIARIAQKARAAGIHLILATQRPSVDVLTGLIKANVPSRIAFQVSSKIDSRTILDAQGAESLLGHGDMLFAPTGKPTMRVHGAFISDSEVDALTKYLRTQGEPEYEEAITQPVPPASMGAFGASEIDGEQDELFDQAVHEVLASGKTSISYVQRKLSIGYNRAAKLIETMERAGILSRANDRGVRQILIERNPFDD
ncbi:MAG: DNA translocase FtsK 4TM domain-containing protein [Cardiobacteriaceae bacterium]|nr:DNA translocase FtsK 4TM domain-containing protein [Cardiobacteriaceae bacterium]